MFTIRIKYHQKIKKILYKNKVAHLKIIVYKGAHIDLLMNENTNCYLVEADEWTRRACLEALDESAFSTITVEKNGVKKSYSAWQTTIGFARQVRFNGQESNKPINFKVVVKCSRTSEALRFALASEWVISHKRRKSLKRAVDKGIRMIHGRIGTISEKH